MKRILSSELPFATAPATGAPPFCPEGAADPPVPAVEPFAPSRLNNANPPSTAASMTTAAAPPIIAKRRVLPGAGAELVGAGDGVAGGGGGGVADAVSGATFIFAAVGA